MWSQAGIALSFAVGFYLSFLWLFVGCDVPGWMFGTGLPFLVLATWLSWRARRLGGPGGSRLTLGVCLSVQGAAMFLAAFAISRNLREYGTVLYADCGGPRSEHVACAEPARLR